ncbi:hypothetical protein DFH28DRAFT_903693, partial [Melampsora americana]
SDLTKFYLPGFENNKIDEHHPLYLAQNQRNGLFSSKWSKWKGAMKKSDRNRSEKAAVDTFEEIPSSENNKDEKHNSLYYSNLVQSTNLILLSDQEDWALYMKEMLDTFEKGSSLQQISLFQILREFLRLEKLPFRVLQVIHWHLLLMKDIRGESASLDNWHKELGETVQLCLKRYKRD